MKNSLNSYIKLTIKDFNDLITYATVCAHYRKKTKSYIKVRIDLITILCRKITRNLMDRLIIVSRQWASLEWPPIFYALG